MQQKFSKNKKQSLKRRRVFFKFKRLSKKFYWRKRLLRRLKRYQISRNFFKTKKIKNNKKKYAHRLVIRISANNIYCTLVQLNPLKTLLVGSAGKFRVKMSKKLLRRYALERILKLFICKAERFLNRRGLIVYLTSPIRTRKKILKLLFRLRKYTIIKKGVSFKAKGFRAILIKVIQKKIFNGCRAPKKKRKKRKNWRLKG